MSFLAEAWADAQKPQTGGQLHLLRIIASHYRDEEGYAWPSNRYLAAKTLASEATVERNLTALERQGYLRRETKTWGPNGGAKRHIYLSFDAEQVEEGLRQKRARPSRKRAGEAQIRSPQNEGTCRDARAGLRGPQIEGQVPSFCGSGPLTGEGTESLGTPLGNTRPPNPPEDGGTNASQNRDGDQGSGGTGQLASDGASAASTKQKARQGGDAAAGGEPDPVAARFAELAAVWPDGLVRSRERDARALFGALSDSQQIAAIAAARAYAAHVQRKPGYAFALQTWLRQTDFSAPPRLATGTAAPPTRVFVREGSPEWDAWAAHYRRQGRPMMTPIQIGGQDGWRFESALPPAATVAA
ncbi:helix-turn-helix domain-containing protein [Methylobacterium sp. J-030]|uniref:helix-turn-helix domain-containing protein n=1 Tax=Methylobacterium sp. J-030 TaxID=2836627 RepID=UPI001FB8A3BE|nr:helix-turn-helix domain-containing protein [Methylobacterium sp. J-030]MCJ2067791.1 helix-turn-helix domain-containing protein [Methylobacterium sp. J-030]